ncbi:MAG: N-6 DNA methylase [Bryobacteraceae bacterium]
MDTRSETPYAQVLKGLREIGYRGALLEENYGFVDWFTPGLETREIAAAAFGQTPIAYDSALIGIARANGACEQALVNQYRALGAPVVLEIAASEIREWAVSHKENDHRLIDRCPVDRIEQLIAERASDWRPENFLRGKNISKFPWNQQLELFSGLLPELEGQIQEKLDPLLRHTLSLTKDVYRDATDHDPDESKLFKLVFWLLTAKVFHDRRLKGFDSLGPDPDRLLAAVAKHYKSQVPALLTREARQTAANRIWADLDFRNLSVEVLAHIWSTTLIDPDTIRRLGIHRTSRTIVRYIVERVPFQASGDDERIILEPCAGSAVFLIGAMNALRQKWFGVTPPKRHEYFTNHLAAIERDPFGEEISTLALTLADFPNPNGWDVRHGDVFMPGVLTSHLKRAGVVLCNPPFGDFDDDERRKYATSSTKKPVELLSRVLDDLHPQGVIGFVLPRLFINGRGYSEIRRRLAARFATLHVTALPDKAFASDAEVALLIASDPIPHNSCRVITRKVNDTPEEWRKFELWHEVSTEYTTEVLPDEAERSLPVPDLPEVWKFLKNYPTLGEAAILGRGLEWNEPLTNKGVETGNRAKFVKSEALDGYLRGVGPRTDFNVFQVPEMSYLSVKREDQRTNAWRQEWQKPKAILNKSARSRGAWRLAAFPDTEGVTSYQTFIGVWPKSQRYDAWLLSAILNSPVANAFVAAREGKTDVTIETLCSIPLPRFTDARAQEIRELIRRYQQATELLPIARGPTGAAERLLKEIDAVVLSAYHFPPRLERQLLDFFRGHPRPTSHSFSDYFPVDMEVFFSLLDYLSPQFAIATIGDLRKRLGETDEDVSG